MNTEKEARMKELEEIILDSKKPIAEKAHLAEYQKLYDEQHAEEKAKAEVKSKEMRNRRRRGKYLEKKTARDVGGRADGRAGKKDVASGIFHIETKSHKKTPKYLQKIMSEAVRLAGKGKIPVAVIYDRTLGDKYVILDYKDWIDLHGK